LRLRRGLLNSGGLLLQEISHLSDTVTYTSSLQLHGLWASNRPTVVTERLALKREFSFESCRGPSSQGPNNQIFELWWCWRLANWTRAWF